MTLFPLLDYYFLCHKSYNSFSIPDNIYISTFKCWRNKRSEAYCKISDDARGVSRVACDHEHTQKKYNRVGTKRRPKTPGRRPKTQKRRPPQNRLEITFKWFECDYRPTQKQETTGFAVLNECDQSLRFVHNPTKCTKRRPPQNRLEITSNWFERDCGPKQKRETARFAVINKFYQGLRFVHNPRPKVQNEDPFKIVLKSLQNGSNVIVNRSRNKKQHDLRLLQHAGRYKIHTFKLLSNILLTK